MTDGFTRYTGLCLLLLNAACIFYVLSVSSNSWIRLDPDIGTGTQYVQYGMWESCSCVPNSDAKSSLATTTPPTDLGWFTATQVFITLGLIGLIACLVLMALYIFIPQLTQKAVLISIVVACFVSAVSMFIGIIIFGAEAPKESGPFTWQLHVGFATAIVAACFTAGSGALGVMQMTQ